MSNNLELFNKVTNLATLDKKQIGSNETTMSQEYYDHLNAGEKSLSNMGVNV
jgi:hypothetical protein